jgi:stage II sporulation protein D
MPALRAFILSLSVFFYFGVARGMSGKKPEVAPLPQFSREVPVQLYRGEIAEVEIYDNGAVECYRDGRFAEIYYISSRLVLLAEPDGIAIHDDNGEFTSGLSGAKFVPRGGSFARFSGKSYRGFFKAVYDDQANDFRLYNIVDLEDYLLGVLPAEIGERSEEEFEAAKAQAVAARTYAVWRMISENQEGMLYPTIADQVYVGKDAELDILSRAVKDTEGEILTYNGVPVAAYYHAVCGGETIPIEKAWPDKDRSPCLIGADDDNYCLWARTYYWTEVFDPATLSNNLNDYHFSRLSATPADIGKIVDIEFSTDSTTGRVTKMKVYADSAVFAVDMDQIRWALGRPSKPGAILPSTKFEANKIRNEKGLQGLVLFGVGNGHGVGACQCGFIGRARAGQKYMDILREYYHDAKIVRLY